MEVNQAARRQLRPTDSDAQSLPGYAAKQHRNQLSIPSHDAPESKYFVRERKLPA